MSLKIEGSSCARCKAYLFSDDDVVYCPICGAPHHRECYNSLGHCALETLHGTPDEYSREKELEALEEIKKRETEAENKADKNTKVCSMCSEEYPANEGRCPKCGTPDFSRINGFEGFDFLGGIPADYILDENVTADDAKRFVAANTQRYIPKFATLNKSNKVSWNWMAFLFPCGWMLARKMFKGGIIAGLLTVIITLFSVPLELAFYNIDVSGATSYQELLNAFPEVGKGVIIFALIGTLLDLGLRIFTALFGDYFYRSYSLAAIKKIKAQSTDIDYDYRKKGGANLLYFFLGTIAIQYLSLIIFNFF